MGEEMKKLFNEVWGKKGLYCKLMGLDRPPAKIRSKSYLNRLLVDFCDSIPAVRSIVVTISIRIRTQISILKSILNRKSSILSKISRI